MINMMPLSINSLTFLASRGRHLASANNLCKLFGPRTGLYKNLRVNFVTRKTITRNIMLYWGVLSGSLTFHPV